MYQLLPHTLNGPANCVRRLEDGAYVPFAEKNGDYQMFVNDIDSGAELLDADGVAMSHDDALAFLASLSANV